MACARRLSGQTTEKSENMKSDSDLIDMNRKQPFINALGYETEFRGLLENYESKSGESAE